jgi:thermostable 8-oxoguanine DNA glycosylase
MSKVAECAGDEVRMKVLVEEVAGIGVPIASAILTVCYPDRFTILDYRAWEALFHFKKVESKSIPVDIGSYFNYLGKCREMAREKNMSLRELDHALWGWSKRNSIINLACRKLI